VRQLWLRWLGLLVFVVVLGGIFLRLGEWQVHRLEQRKESNAVVVAHENNPVMPLSQRGYAVVQDGDQWQRVSVTGTFDASHQLEVRYRSNDGATGTEVVTRCAQKTARSSSSTAASSSGARARHRPRRSLLPRPAP